jgi:hypothetical protein
MLLQRGCWLIENYAYRRCPEPDREFRHVVSLHNHSCHSVERLASLNRVVKKRFMRPLKGTLQRSFGLDGVPNLNYAEMIFHPPYTPEQVYDMEASSVAPLGFQGIHFSITDHDQYVGGAELLGKRPDLKARVAIGEELSLRFEGHLFHLGLVGFPEATVDETHRALQAAASAAQYDELFKLLHASGCLVVLNHPLVHWSGAGPEGIPVGNLMRRYGWAIDAIEFNGMRGAEENSRVLELARTWRKPVVGGGDSHLLVAGGALCVSQSSCMRDFISEVKSGHCVVLVKPDYWAPLGWKLFLRVLFFIAHYRQIAEFRDQAVAEMLKGRRVLLDPAGSASHAFLAFISALGLAR